MDTITLEVKSPTDTWGPFSDFLDSTGDGCSSPFASQSPGDFAFEFTCTDFSNGTIFRDAKLSFDGVPFDDPNSFGILAIFYTDPGALLFLSDTNEAGKETVLFGEKPVATPEPSFVWPLAACLVGLAAWHRRTAGTAKRY